MNDDSLLTTVVPRTLETKSKILGLENFRCFIALAKLIYSKPNFWFHQHESAYGVWNQSCNGWAFIFC